VIGYVTYQSLAVLKHVRVNRQLNVTELYATGLSDSQNFTSFI